MNALLQRQRCECHECVQARYAMSGLGNTTSSCIQVGEALRSDMALEDKKQQMVARMAMGAWQDYQAMGAQDGKVLRNAKTDSGSTAK